MPVSEKDGRSYEYPLPRNGVNLGKNIVELDPTEAISTENLIWKSGLLKRGGYSLLNTTEAVTDKKIVGLHRFYFSSDKETLAAADDEIMKDNENNTWTSIHTFGTAAQPTTMNSWANLGIECIANGTDNAIMYNGTTVTPSQSLTITVTIAGLSAGDKIKITVNGTVYTFQEVAGVAPDWNDTGNATTTATSIKDAINFYNTVLLATSSLGVVTVTPVGTTNAIEKIQYTSSADVVYTSTYTGLVTSNWFAAPKKVKQFLSYQDRLLSIDNTNPGYLRWSASFDESEWEPLGQTSGDVRPDSNLNAMIIHSLSEVDTGYDSAVLLAGDTSMYLFKGSNLDPSDTAADYRILELGIKAGCTAPKTLQWTPKGSMWLGTDKQVYLLPFDSVTPVPVGDKIISNNVEMGLESIPAGQISNACAIYHDGYYKIAFAGTNSTQNNVQYWLDITRLSQDDSGQFGPWYGPMTGMNINIFALRNGPGDIGDLISGDGSASERGYVYRTNVKGIYSDIDVGGSAQAIECEWKTFFNVLGEPSVRKEVNQIEIELKDTGGAVTVEYWDITGEARVGISGSFTLNLEGFLWGDALWGEEFWSGTGPRRYMVSVDPTVSPRRLQLIINHSSAINELQIFGLRAFALEQSKVYDQAGGKMAIGNLGDGDGSNYPTAIDTQSPVETDGVTIARADVPNDLADAIKKIEGALGIAPAGGQATVVLRLSQGHNTYGAHKYTVTDTAVDLTVNVNTDEFINVTATSTITLPSAVTYEGRMYIISRNFASGRVTVTASAGQVGGQTNRYMDADGDMLHVVSNGTNWIIVSYVGLVW